MNLFKIFESIQVNGGATYNLHDDTLNPTEGYICAFLGYEQTVSIPANVNQLSDIIHQYLNADRLKKINESPYNRLGFWIYDGKLVIDISEHIINYGWALRKGFQRNQKAIWDCASNAEIVLQPLDYKYGDQQWDGAGKKVSNDPDIETDKRH